MHRLGRPAPKPESAILLDDLLRVHLRTHTQKSIIAVPAQEHVHPGPETVRIQSYMNQRPNGHQAQRYQENSESSTPAPFSRRPGQVRDGWRTRVLCTVMLVTLVVFHMNRAFSSYAQLELRPAPFVPNVVSNKGSQ